MCLAFHALEESVTVKSCSVQSFSVFCARCTTEVLRAKYRGADKSLARPGRKKNYSDRRFWVSYILFIIIIGGILLLFIYITRLASNEIFSPSNKIHREVGRAKNLSAPPVRAYTLKIFTIATNANSLWRWKKPTLWCVHICRPICMHVSMRPTRNPYSFFVLLITECQKKHFSSILFYDQYFGIFIGTDKSLW
jgi:hypothetical protein